MSLSDLRAVAMKVLHGVGVLQKQWEEWSGVALHVRRRLTAKEALHTGEASDLRGTSEAKVRALRMGPILEHIPPAMLAEELEKSIKP